MTFIPQKGIFGPAPYPEASQNQGMRFNEGKPQWSLIDFKSLEPMVRVLEFGAKKYARDNWKKGLDKNQILESMMRHVVALMDGEVNDSESGLPHIGHIMCNTMFWSFMNRKEGELSNRIEMNNIGIDSLKKSSEPDFNVRQG